MDNRIEITGQSLLSPDYSCGATLDKVVEIAGIMPRKPGESDEELRARVIEEMRRLDSLACDPGPPPDLFPFKNLRIDITHG